MNKSGRPRGFNKPEVINAAMDAFWSKGYEGCSTEDLCTSTGLGRGSLYNAFGSKHELYELALSHYHEHWIQEQTALLERPVPVKERLRGFLEWAVEKDFEDSSKGCLLINATMERGRMDSTVETVANLHVESLESVLCRVIEQGIQSGEITSDRSALDLSRSFLCSYYGLRILNASTRNLEMAEQLVESTMVNMK
ncbi:TetR family transcriptional regulator [Paenibacillus sp. BIHB 4019]|uniref:TetR family transcriptional regulator n=1 Tax=Paenibacillus sp. BIHB 4019 TaxID=1870819 RepID=A0A1B2DR81_9BACL|nr:TetR/AcrR family transcriptional regulator [Paenibacillus sp. BIHB 4019]ANY70233.1 TetR family transcriptional regulator [Paenibacillus sp. BIHB 4019]